MNITEVRVKLMHQRTDRLRAFCSVTIDNDFVVHDLRVIEGRKGFFVAMPSRKLSDSCPRCSSKNPLRAKFCNDCGNRLEEDRVTREAQARDKLYVDVAHPINTACREMLQARVLQAYKEEEEERVGEGVGPEEGYSAQGLDELADEYADVNHDVEEGGAAPAEEARRQPEGETESVPEEARRQPEGETESVPEEVRWQPEGEAESVPEEAPWEPEGEAELVPEERAPEPEAELVPEEVPWEPEDEAESVPEESAPEPEAESVPEERAPEPEETPPAMGDEDAAETEPERQPEETDQDAGAFGEGIF